MSRRSNVKAAVRASLMVALCLVSLTGCAGLRSRHADPFVLHGMVYDDNGQPAAGVEFTLDGEQKTLSDYNGRFYFVNVMLGEHDLEGSGRDLEPIERTVMVSREAEVLYIRMASVGGLYQSCLAALREKSWKDADAYVARALAITPAAPLLRYAKAICLSAPARPDRDWVEAERLLRGLLADGYAEPAIYLLLADLCQYDREDKVEAAHFLAEYLRFEYDPRIEERLRGLE